MENSILKLLSCSVADYSQNIKEWRLINKKTADKLDFYHVTSALDDFIFGS